MIAPPPSFNNAAPAARALLFDMDGLLVDSEPLWLRVEADVAARFGRTWSAAQAEGCAGTGLRRTAEILIETLSLPLDVDGCVALFEEGYLARLGELAPKPGALALVRAARGRCRVALATSSPRRLAEAVLASLGVRDDFDAIASGSEVKTPKPEPDVFLLAAERVGVEPRATIVLEDSVPGAIAGKRAGAFVLGVPDFHTDRARLAREADVVLESLVGVGEWLFEGAPCPASTAG